jgi:hypothetical protein
VWQDLSFNFFAGPVLYFIVLPATVIVGGILWLASFAVILNLGGGGAREAFVVASMALSIGALIDAWSRPDQAWSAAHRHKNVWLWMLVLGLIACGIGWIAAGFYLAFVRPAVKNARPGG